MILDVMGGRPKYFVDQTAKEEMNKALSHVEPVLAKQDFLVNNEFCAADIQNCYVFAALRHGKYLINYPKTLTFRV